MAMHAVCGIDIDKDMTFLSFAEVKKGDVIFLDEARFNKGMGDDLLKFLQDNIGDLRKIIDDVGIRRKVTIDNIFIKLPAGLEKMNVAEEVIALKRTKKIAPGDLVSIKKYLEDNAIDWDDCCVHHFPLNFGVEGKAYESFPVGFWTKRLRMKSLLVTVKDRLRIQVKDIFDTYDMPFGGFVSTGISDFSATFTQAMGVKAVINIGYENTLLTVVNKGLLRAVESFRFGMNDLIAEIADKLSISPQIAREIFDMYVSFLPDKAAGKEINIKDADMYINISMQKVNTLSADYLRARIEPVLSRLVNEGDGVCVSFLGRLNGKEGFEEFLRSFVPYEVMTPQYQVNASSSFGCARYGVSKFLENVIQPRLPLGARLARLYKDYF